MIHARANVISDQIDVTLNISVGYLSYVVDIDHTFRAVSA